MVKKAKKEKVEKTDLMKLLNKANIVWLPLSNWSQLLEREERDLLEIGVNGWQ